MSERQVHPEQKKDPGGLSVNMIRPHMRDIPEVPFPEGYGIRAMTLDDIGLWTDIERDAEPYATISDTLFQREFGHDPEGICQRCLIITDSKGLGVGTISAWYNRDFRGKDYGRIHWVAVRRSCQGKSLGKAALSHAMKKLAQWHDRCYLVTSSERVGAIALYLKFGFEPDMIPENASAAWNDVNVRLEDPVISKALELGARKA